MTIDEIKEKFNECKNSLSYKRINPNHPVNIYIGYNEKGNQSLAIISEKCNLDFESTRLIDVELKVRNDGDYVLSFNLLDDSLSDIFYQFISDIVEKTYNIKDYSPIAFVIERWKKWINMFKNPKNIFLSENEVRGLLGELIYLEKYMFDKYGIDRSLESWIGSSLSHKDFEIEDIWYELKTIKENALTVTISSIEQLDSNEYGELVLVKLEPSNESISEPINLNDYINKIRSCFSNDSQLNTFNEKLDERKYFYAPEYDKYVYSIKSIDHYGVTEEFPRLKENDLPDSIARASYELYIKKIEKFKID